MKNVLKIFVALFSLSAILGYSIYRQKQSQPVLPVGGFPVTPASPTMFNTSKSGPIEVDPIVIKGVLDKFDSEINLSKSITKPDMPIPKLSELIDQIQNEPVNPYSNLPKQRDLFSRQINSTKSAAVLDPKDILQWTEGGTKSGHKE